MWCGHKNPLFNSATQPYSLSWLHAPWPESESELYLSSDNRLSEKWVPNFEDKGCHVVSVKDPYGRILGFLDLSRYFGSLSQSAEPEWSNIKYTRMPSPVYQKRVNLIVSFPVWRRLIIFMDVAMWKHRTFDCEYLDVSNFATLTPLSFLISCKFSFPIVGLKMSSLSTLAMKSPNKIFIWY
jgi:hypothetical protein